MKWLKTYEELVNSEYKCSICGSNLYVTHEGGIKTTLQCSSDEAKFWEFPRGSKEQKKSHKHFMESIKYIDKNQS